MTQMQLSKLSDIKNYLETSNKFHIIKEIDFINNDKSLRCQTIFINADRAFIDIYITIKNDKLLLTDFGDSIQSILTWGLCTSNVLEKEYFQSLIQNITETYEIKYNNGMLECEIENENKEENILQKILNEKLIITKSFLNLCQACIRISDLYLIFYIRAHGEPPY